MIEIFECPKYVTKIEYVGPHQITTTGKQGYSVAFTTNDMFLPKKEAKSENGKGSKE